MNFNDEDLKRLKQHINDEDYNIITVSSDKLEALIARMECAEKLCIYIYGYPDLVPYEKELLEAWRKAAGK